MFNNNEKRRRDQPGVEQDSNDMPPTQIGRALQELNITWIAAHSPQAKGRVERSFDTAQDRLVNLPAGQEPDRSSRYYAGALPFFGIGETMSHSDESTHHTDAGASMAYNITQLVRALKANGEWRGSEMSITFVVPRELMEDIPGAVVARPRFENVTVAAQLAPE